MDYPKLISEKWNLTAKFNCLQAIYFDAPSALAVLCVRNSRSNMDDSLDERSETDISDCSEDISEVRKKMSWIYDHESDTIQSVESH